MKIFHHTKFIIQNYVLSLRSEIAHYTIITKIVTE